MSASPPRIAPLELEEAERRAAAIGLPGFLVPLSIFRVLLHHPRLAKGFSDFLGTMLFNGRVDQRLRELVIMRLGWATGSVYEWTQHWRIATGLGLTPEEILAVRHWQDHEGFGPAERAVLAAVDETLADGFVDAATWDALRANVSDDTATLVEIVTVVGGWRMVSSMLQSLAVPLEDGVDPWPPDGATPTGA